VEYRTVEKLEDVLCEVHVEEINVQTGLNNACCDGDGVDKSFGEISGGRHKSEKRSVLKEALASRR
jgi:hypothetical protein